MNAVLVRTLEEGLAHHEQGRASEAERLYGDVLEQDPAAADAWHLMGRLWLERRDFSSALACVAKAISLRPDLPAFHKSLGDVLAVEGRAREAALCYQEAVRLDPNCVAAWVALGDLLQSQGQADAACGAFVRAIEADPDSAEAFNNLGNTLRSLGRMGEALECYRQSLRLRPDQAEAPVNLSAWCLRERREKEAEQWARRALELRPGLVPALSNLSMALVEQQRYGEAEAPARQAVARAPGAAHLHCNLGSVLLHQRKWDEAEGECRKAMELAPGHPQASLNRGVILQATGRLDEAAAQLHDLLEAEPRNAAAWTNLGTVRAAQGRHDAALFCFEEALRIEPDHPKAHFCRSLEWLGRGRLAEGFAEYEWRWKVARAPRSGMGKRWDGGPLEGRTILLTAEQGLGDTIQFARYIPLVAARGGRVVLESQKGAAPVVRSVQGVVEVILPDDPLPDFDVQAPLMSLPAIFGTTPESIPADVPYLQCEPGEAKRWETRLGTRTGLRVGLAWAGNPENGGDLRRSMPLDSLSPVGKLAKVECFSLHNGAQQRESVRAASGWLRDVLSDDGGLLELGALMSCMDLVITVDTMPAHLAGAMGLRVWTVLCASPDWRWMRGGKTTAWYPSMRLFRQREPGEWGGVVESVVGEIRAMVHSTF